MDIKLCSEPNCHFEVEYVCKYTSPAMHFCKHHAWKHIELSSQTHALELIFIDPCEAAKEAILGLLTKVKSEHIKLKRKILASFSQYLIISEKYIKMLIKNLDSSSDVISNFSLKIEKAQKISKLVQDPILELLALQPNEAVEKVKIMIPNNSDWYESAELFCGFSEKIRNIVENFIRDKSEAHLSKTLTKVESMQEEHSKAINLTNSQLANTNDSISLKINESSEILKELENVKEPIKQKTINKPSLLEPQICTVTNNHNSKLKETESSLNTLDSLRNKTVEILSRPNDPELELDFRAARSK